MKKAVYRLILFAAITAFVLSLLPTVKAEPNDTQTKQTQCIASDTTPLCKADVQKPTPPKQPASDKETHPQKLEDEKSEANVYKDDVDNLKWAIKVIAGLVTAFVGFAFASMGVILFKNKKDYEHALADAKEAARDAKDAAQNAHDLEKEAQQVLVDIEKRATAKLEEIDTKAKETMLAIKAEAKAGQVEIEKKGNEERQKSLEEAERQRKISELFNKAWEADKAKDYQTVADCCMQIVEEQKEDKEPTVYNSWGAALTELAKHKKGKEAEDLFNQAIEKYKKAIEINPDYFKAYSNWGVTLIKLAKSKEGKEAEDLSNQAIEKCKKAIDIKPNHYMAYNNWCAALTELAKHKKGKEAEVLYNQAIEKCIKLTEIKPDAWRGYNAWGAALLYLAKLKGGKDAEDILKQAEEKCLKAGSIKTGKGSYNLACLYAHRGNEDKCQEWLKVGEKAGALSPREHAMADDDLKSVRDKDWFKKLRWKGE
jgi:tetratricopeptide (TPR) repeat protein